MRHAAAQLTDSAVGFRADLICASQGPLDLRESRARLGLGAIRTGHCCLRPSESSPSSEPSAVEIVALRWRLHTHAAARYVCRPLRSTSPSSAGAHAHSTLSPLQSLICHHALHRGVPSAPDGASSVVTLALTSQGGNESPSAGDIKELLSSVGSVARRVKLLWPHRLLRQRRRWLRR